MPLDVDAIGEACAEISAGPDTLCVTFPGGMEICIQGDPDKLDPSDQVKKLFDTVNTALAPLQPVFTVIDAVISIKDCIEALIDALGPPPSPKPIIDCLTKLLALVEKLLKLIPQYSIPLLVAQFLDALIIFVKSFKAQIEHIIDKVARQIETGLRAAELGNLTLQASVDCTLENLGLELQNMGQQAEPINLLIGTINAFLDIVGLPCIPSLEVPTELVKEALAPFDLLIKILQALRDAIPVLSPPPGSGFSKPCE